MKPSNFLSYFLLIGRPNITAVWQFIRKMSLIVPGGTTQIRLVILSPYREWRWHKCRLFVLLLSCLVSTSFGYAAKKSSLEQSFVRVKVTAQTYSLIRPWEKKRPRSRKGVGVVLSNNKILVTARLIASSTFVELEDIDSGEKCPATVVEKDYAANMAMLAPADNQFLSKKKPLEIASKNIEIGDKLDAIQFENNGTPVVTVGYLKGIEVESYAFNVNALLVFKMEVVLSDITHSHTLPVVNRGKLVGLMMGYDKGDQILTMIPPPVIQHFLSDLNDGQYQGFPHAGFSFLSLEDPQLRRYLGLKNGSGGIFIDKVRPEGPADNAGLQSGDVLLAIDYFEIDKSGQYDDPGYGKQSISHLTTTRSISGAQRTFRVLRNKKEMDIEVTLQTLRPEKYPVPLYSLDKAPEYIVVGGLVFQGLSRQFLKEWGGSWTTSSPQKLLHYFRNQWDLVEPGKNIVFLSQVLPSEGNMGYGRLVYLILESINEIKIVTLKDIPKALNQPINGFHKFEFQQDPNVIYLDAKVLPIENEIIQKRYNLPALLRLN